MVEVWLPVKGWETLYEVSNLGRVRSLTRNKTIKKQHLIPTGYWAVALSVKHKTFSRRVHRLVAEAFIPNPENKPQVNHIDGDRKNNNAANLEWVTQRENSLHATYTLGKNPSNWLSKKVKCLETGQVFISQHEAARKMGLNQGHINHALRGVCETHGGYHWEYVN